MRKYVDPAEGWKYGFPAIWDDEKLTYEEFLDVHKYPEELRNYPTRWWSVPEDEKKEDSEESS